MVTFWLNLLGALATFAGSMMMAFSIGKLPGEAYQINKRGKKVQMAGIRRGRFLSGAILLAVGFAFTLARVLIG
jgi:hypothetical protein